jgi:hypothetical protein
MNRWFAVAAAMALSAVFAGCAGNANMPLVFGQSQVVGISISASSVQQGGDFSLGYKDINLAVVPVTVMQADGNSTQLKSEASPGGGDRYTDALSVLGQFELRSDTKVPDIGLGKFFATGLAAKRLADGFVKLLETRGSPGGTEGHQP